MLSQSAHETARTSELFVVLKAALSSGAATFADGVVFQFVLFALPAHYGFVAGLGAIAGAAVNFMINRHYTFAGGAEGAVPQAVRYAAVSLATFLALRLMLAGLVEGLGWSSRVAWLPAKLAAFALVSYPAQRLWVFARRAPA